MPTRPPHVCPRCRAAATGTCPCRADARRDSDQARGDAASRGYDHRWRRTRLGYLRAHRLCVTCGRLATVADHHPHTRRQLIAMGVPDPDAWHRLRALCKPCHDAHTARTTPGGWNWRGAL